VRTTDRCLPLVVRRDEDVIVSFDIRDTRCSSLSMTKDRINTYIPGFNIQMVPEVMRHIKPSPIPSLRAPRCLEVAGSYQRLPLTGLFRLATLFQCPA
jgi:hypothetical protein